VPARDSFLARRIAGPGLSFSFCYQVSSDDALIALQLQLETEELQLFSDQMGAKIKQPQEQLTSFISQVFGQFGTTVDSSHSLFQTMSIRTQDLLESLAKKLQSRRECFPNVENKSSIRQTSLDLQSTLTRGQRLVEKYFSQRVFPVLSSSEISTFWKLLNIPPNNWVELTKILFERVLGPQFLQPLQELDKTFNLKVDQLNVRKFLQMIEKAEPRDHLDKVTTVFSDETNNKISASVQRIGLGDVVLSRSSPVCVESSFYPLGNIPYLDLFKNDSVSIKLTS